MRKRHGEFGIANWERWPESKDRKVAKMETWALGDPLNIIRACEYNSLRVYEKYKPSSEECFPEMAVWMRSCAKAYVLLALAESFSSLAQLFYSHEEFVFGS